MGLITSITNLKSLKFGKDSVGGDSNQPYIITPIPESRLINNPDFILKGGSIKRTAKDVERITKFFTDKKSGKGLMFVAKQELLSRISPKTQSSGKIFNDGLYNPLNTIVEIGGSAIGLHFPKQTRQSIYSDIVKSNNDLDETNRLIILSKGAKYTDKNTGIIYNDGNNILSYGGGPGSNLGIGKTNILFADQRTGLNNPKLSFFKENRYDFNKTFIRNNNKTIDDIKLPLGLPLFYFLNEKIQLRTTPLSKQNGYTYELPFNTNVYKKPSSSTSYPFEPNLDKTTQNNTKTLTQEELNNISNLNIERGTKYFVPKIKDFRNKDLRIYQTKNIENRLNLGNPNSKIKSEAFDKINALEVLETKDDLLNDSIQFRIQAITYDGQPDYIMQFRAFLNSISDSYNSDWSSKRYIGRAENFYNYVGFNRSISLGWTVAAQSRKELIPMYNRLNYLASNLCPSYSTSGYMRGPLVKLTIGGYLHEVSGFINSLTYDIQEDTTWDIGIGEDGNVNSSINELPHIIRVNNFNFTPIHDFISERSKGTKFISLKNNGYKNNDTSLLDDNGAQPDFIDPFGHIPRVARANN